MRSTSPLAAAAALLLAMCAASGPATSPTPSPRPGANSGAPQANEAKGRPTLGATRETAIEVCKPTGQREYLRRLRCADGAAPNFSRVGSYGMRTAPRTPAEEKLAAEQALGGTPIPPGGADYHVLDKYEVACADRTAELFFDMYHCDKPPPDEAPSGFTLVAR